MGLIITIILTMEYFLYFASSEINVHSSNVNECQFFNWRKKAWVTNYGRVETKLCRKRRKNMLAEFVIEKIEADRYNGTNSNNSLPGKYTWLYQTLEFISNRT